MAGIKARWEMDDKARAIARAEEENYRRSVEWHRREAKMDAVKRVSISLRSSHCFRRNLILFRSVRDTERKESFARKNWP